MVHYFLRISSLSPSPMVSGRSGSGGTSTCFGYLSRSTSSHAKNYSSRSRSSHAKKLLE